MEILLIGFAVAVVTAGAAFWFKGKKTKPVEIAPQQKAPRH